MPCYISSPHHRITLRQRLHPQTGHYGITIFYRVQIRKSNKYRILPLLGEDMHTVFDRYEEKLTEIIEDCNAADKQIMFFAIRNKMAARIELEVKRYQSIQQETTNLTSDDIDQEIVSFMQNLSEDNIESELELVEQHVDEYEEEWVKRNGFNDA